MNKLKQGIFALLLIGITVIAGACNASQEVTSSPHSSSPMQNISSEDIYSSKESSFEVSEENVESSKESSFEESSVEDTSMESSQEESSSDDAAMESSRGGFELPEDVFN